MLVIIPPGVTNGHKGITKTALLANTPDIPHDKLEPNEMVRIDPDTKDIPYDWERKNR